MSERATCVVYIILFTNEISKHAPVLSPGPPAMPQASVASTPPPAIPQAALFPSPAPSPLLPQFTPETPLDGLAAVAALQTPTGAHLDFDFESYLGTTTASFLYSDLSATFQPPLSFTQLAPVQWLNSSLGRAIAWVPVQALGI